MTNDKDSVISAMRFNIEEKEKYIRCLEEDLYQLKKVINAQAIATLPELVEACQELHEHPALQSNRDIGGFHCIIDRQTLAEIKQALAEIEGKEGKP